MATLTPPESLLFGLEELDPVDFFPKNTPAIGGIITVADALEKTPDAADEQVGDLISFEPVIPSAVGKEQESTHPETPLFTLVHDSLPAEEVVDLLCWEEPGPQLEDEESGALPTSIIHSQEMILKPLLKIYCFEDIFSELAHAMPEDADERSSSHVERPALNSLLEDSEEEGVGVLLNAHSSPMKKTSSTVIVDREDEEEEEVPAEGYTSSASSDHSSYSGDADNY